MKYNVKMAEEAKRQLDEAMAWYADRELDVAVEWYLGFAEAIRSLAENPERHGYARENEDFPYELYSMLYESGRRKTHRAVYRIVGRDVEVLTIRHHAQRDLTPEDLESTQ